MDYLDSNGLSYYNRKIKGHIDSVIENSVLPMIPKKGVVALGNNGYVTGGQVYNAIGSGGGGGTAEFPFPYVKIKKCKIFSAYISDAYLSGNESSTIYDYHTSDGTVEPKIIKKANTISRLAFYKEEFPTGDPISFEDKYAFDASFFFPPQYHLVSPSSGLGCYSFYTSEGEMEIHNYLSVSNGWMTSTKSNINSSSKTSLCPSVLKIDDKIKYIGELAFYKSNLTLYISAVEPPIIQTNSFYTFKEIHVPSGSLDLYKSANNWSAYGDYMIGDL